MTSAEHPQSGPPETGVAEEPAERVEHGPIWRVVGGSLLAGLSSAVVLTLVVFPGSDEYVITASTLLAFALGWAMLAVLSARLTSQPQRWALVPAAFMAVAALALLVARPGNGDLTAAAWVWPALVLTLAAWMLVQLRRALTGRVRWLLYPVVAILALIAVGAMYESIALVRDEHRYSMPGRSYEVAGHRLHLNCTGTGSPTVIFESGLGETSPVWARITARVDGTTRVCTYDRAGQGWSGDGPGPQDGLAVASDLHTLLARAHEDGPYVLVGHSVGGSYAMIYAAQYPNDVAGMVLLDSASPYQFTALPDFSGQYAMSRRLYGVLPSIARIGLWHAFPSSFSSLPEPAAAQIRAFETSPRQMRNSRDENSMFRRVFEQAQSLRTLAGKPLVVVTASESLQKIHGWSAAQDRLATLTSNSEHRVVEATHVGLLIEKRPSAASANAIAKIVQSVRTSTPVTAQ